MPKRIGDRNRPNVIGPPGKRELGHGCRANGCGRPCDALPRCPFCEDCLDLLPPLLRRRLRGACLVNCFSEMGERNDAWSTYRVAKSVIDAGGKIICTDCLVPKDWREFLSDSSRKRGRAHRCRRCQKLRDRARQTGTTWSLRERVGGSRHLPAIRAPGAEERDELRPLFAVQPVFDRSSPPPAATGRMSRRTSCPLVRLAIPERGSAIFDL